MVMLVRILKVNIKMLIGKILNIRKVRMVGFVWVRLEWWKFVFFSERLCV